MAIYLGFKEHPTAGGGGNTISFITSGTSTVSTITIPASSATGDIAVLCQAATAAGGTSPSAVTPSGWTTLSNDFIDAAGDGNSYRVMLSWKKLVGGDSGSSITGMNGSGTNRKGIMIFRGSSANTPSTFSPVSTFVTTDPASQTVSTTGKSAPVLGIGHCYHSTSASKTFTGSLSANNLAGGSAAQDMFYEIENSTVTDSTLDTNDTGAVNAIQCFGVSFTFP